jgi:hypothetical protein
MSYGFGQWSRFLAEIERIRNRDDTNGNTVDIFDSHIVTTRSGGIFLDYVYLSRVCSNVLWFYKPTKYPISSTGG